MHEYEKQENRKSVSTTLTGNEICHSHLTHNIFNYCMRRFFFGLVYKHVTDTVLYANLVHLRL